MTEGWAELHEAIAAIRIGIEKAVSEGADSTVKFEVGPVELELTAAVHKDASGEVKVSLLPWSAAAKGGASADHTQRITLTLQPIESNTTGSGKPRKKQIADTDDD